jgi:hypothetical protein
MAGHRGEQTLRCERGVGEDEADGEPVDQIVQRECLEPRDHVEQVKDREESTIEQSVWK